MVHCGGQAPEAKLVTAFRYAVIFCTDFLETDAALVRHIVLVNIIIDLIFYEKRDSILNSYRLLDKLKLYVQ
jgi:hypothetical protein